MADYTVTWSMPFDAESPEDAIDQATAALWAAVKYKEGATILILYNEDTGEKYGYDMETSDFITVTHVCWVCGGVLGPDNVRAGGRCHRSCSSAARRARSGRGRG